MDLLNKAGHFHQLNSPWFFNW